MNVADEVAHMGKAMGGFFDRDATDLTIQFFHVPFFLGSSSYDD
jgi:hypothetical protein